MSSHDELDNKYIARKSKANDDAHSLNEYGLIERHKADKTAIKPSIVILTFNNSELVISLVQSLIEFDV